MQWKQKWRTKEEYFKTVVRKILRYILEPNTTRDGERRLKLNKNLGDENTVNTHEDIETGWNIWNNDQ